ncbi:MAG: cytochrome b N-terminal domain-containing protein [Spirochaetia bacterium]|nr:cytochrome b N-terminal domain-containing protein [Spirochaetia bacterium]
MKTLIQKQIQVAKDVYEFLFASYSPKTEREASDAVGFNFLLHWFPVKITKKSLSWHYSFWLGTISLVLFIILSLSGIVLIFLYVPSVERAYQSIKDIEFVVSYGWLIRRMHRWAAHFMVAFVFFHMIRVFLTGAYRSTNVTPQGKRYANWIIGIVLLVLTLLLSYTGYLLPWDQLALWAIVIGANIAKATPIIGDQVQFIMQGGNEIGQNTLILWYAMHIAVLPFIVTALISWHMWRIRKDGGLASVDSLGVKKEGGEPVKSKTYSLMGIAKGVRPSISYHKVAGETVHAIPAVLTRMMIVTVFTVGFMTFLSIFFAVPLEEPATTEWTPNPAKAPWYFLWLQELVSITTIRVPLINLGIFSIPPFTINGGFLGGAVIPGLVVGAALMWPQFDRSPESAVGVWFHKSRLKQNIVFLIIVLALAILTYIGTFMRGPNWGMFLPWESWPSMPVNF